ncbi:MAG: PIN domain-containing protein [Actinomycetota bacterium]
MSAYTLDAWAILAWLAGDEPAASRVQDIVESQRPTVSWVNLVEVEYRLRRNHGAEEAERVFSDLRPIISEELPGIASMRAVARLKAEYPIALGDCFAIATATASRSTLVTGNPEIVDRAPGLDCLVLDLRRG